MRKPRVALVDELAARIDAVDVRHPVRVAVDGPDAAGKTTLADELALALRTRRRQVVRASIDGFHRPRAERYRRGETSAEGYYEDAFDLVALRHELLEPLGPNGSRMYRVAVFDFRADRPHTAPPGVARADAVLLFDGVFLLRPELVAHWDLSILVSVAPAETLRRALERDAHLFGSRAETERRYRERYIPAQRLYFDSARPELRADVIVHNDDPAAAWLTWNPVRRTAATLRP